MRPGLPAALLLAALAVPRGGPAAAQTAPPPAAAPAPATPASTAPASTVAAVALSGQVRTPRSFTPADFQAMPAVTVEVTFAAADGPRRMAFTGVLLWSLLQEAGPVDEPGRATGRRHVLLAHGSDGYSAAVAFGEMDPYLEGKQVLIAMQQDGRLLPAPRLVVPGDAHAARSVRDLVGIEVR